MADLPKNYDLPGQINLMDWLRETNPDAIPKAAEKGKAVNGVLPCRRCYHQAGHGCGSSHTLHYEGPDLICDGFLTKDFMNPPED